LEICQTVSHRLRESQMLLSDKLIQGMEVINNFH